MELEFSGVERVSVFQLWMQFLVRGSSAKASGQVTSMADFISMCDKPAFRHQASFTKSNGCKERLGLPPMLSSLSSDPDLSRNRSCDLLRRLYQTSIELDWRFSKSWELVQEQMPYMQAVLIFNHVPQPPNFNIHTVHTQNNHIWKEIHVPGHHFLVSVSNFWVCTPNEL